MEHARFTLSNGLSAIVIPSRFEGSPVAVQVWFRGGSRVEEKMHVAHLFEHLFFRGGRDFPDWTSVENNMRLLGDVSNAMTADEYLGAFIVTSPLHIRKAVHLLSDMVRYAKCASEDFEKERTAVAQELKITLDDPLDFSGRKFREIMFGSHPLGRVDCERLDALYELVPEDALRYKAMVCGVPNALAVVVGSADIDNTRNLLEEYFGNLPNAVPVVRHPPPDNPPPEETILVARNGAEQAHLYVGARSVSVSHSDFRAAAMLYEILSHRLWNKIRGERGLAYTVFSESRSLSDAGYGLSYAGVEPKAEIVSDALRIMFAEMADIKSGNISVDEIEGTRSVMHAFLDIGLETTNRIGFFFAHQALVAGSVKLPRTIHEEINRVTAADLIRVADSHWKPERMRSLLLTGEFFDYASEFAEARRALGG